MKLLLAPHNDDETLFCFYTILREQPEVYIVTDCHRRLSNGVTPEERQRESYKALSYANIIPTFLHINDDELTFDILYNRLKDLIPTIVFAPALQGGNKEHDIVSEVATALWKDKVIYYATYTDKSLAPQGNIPIIGTREEIELKKKALLKYESQRLHNKPHFDAVENSFEYYIF